VREPEASCRLTHWWAPFINLVEPAPLRLSEHGLRERVVHASCTPASPRRSAHSSNLSDQNAQHLQNINTCQAARPCPAKVHSSTWSIRSAQRSPHRSPSIHARRDGSAAPNLMVHRERDRRCAAHRSEVCGLATPDDRQPAQVSGATTSCA
jgi:hypothetical protein